MLVGRIGDPRLLVSILVGTEDVTWVPLICYLSQQQGQGWITGR